MIPGVCVWAVDPDEPFPAHRRPNLVALSRTIWGHKISPDAGAPRECSGAQNLIDLSHSQSIDAENVYQIGPQF